MASFLVHIRHFPLHFYVGNHLKNSKHQYSSLKFTLSIWDTLYIYVLVMARVPEIWVLGTQQPNYLSSRNGIYSWCSDAWDQGAWKGLYTGCPIWIRNFSKGPHYDLEIFNFFRKNKILKNAPNHRGTLWKIQKKFLFQ